MTDGDRLVDTNVFVHAYILLDPKKQASAREVILPVWEQGDGITTLQKSLRILFCRDKKSETANAARTSS